MRLTEYSRKRPLPQMATFVTNDATQVNRDGTSLCFFFFFFFLDWGGGGGGDT